MQVMKLFLGFFLEFVISCTAAVVRTLTRTSHSEHVERVSCKSRTALSGDYSIGRLDEMSSVTLKA